jgi:ribonuclease D
MSYSKAIETALEAAKSAILLNSGAQISRAAKAWQRCELLGIDTEFVRERTYFANIGLVQISDGQTVWLLDPLIEGALEPLKFLLEDPSVSKIFHSPSEDLDVLLHAVGAVPEPMIDTQLACALLGQPLQMGYHTAAGWLLDVTIDKDQTRSNWCARPLRQVQLRYAALDVCLLPMMWQLLRERLEEKNRFNWLLEDCGKQLEKSRQPVDASMAWQRIRGHGRLDGGELAVLQALAEWREQEARERNRPRGFVIPDIVLLNISRNRIISVTELENIDELHPRAIHRHGDKIIRIVRHVIESGLALETVRPMTTSERKRLAKMRALVLSKATSLGMEPVVLASKRDLEALVLNGHRGWPERLCGWRRREIGSELERELERRS